MTLSTFEKSWEGVRRKGSAEFLGQHSGPERAQGLTCPLLFLLPGYVQACRALMIAASVLGLPAILLLLTVLPCIRMGHEPGVAKYRRAQLAGVMLILLGKHSLGHLHSEGIRSVSKPRVAASSSSRET